MMTTDCKTQKPLGGKPFKIKFSKYLMSSYKTTEKQKREINRKRVNGTLQRCQQGQQFQAEA